MKKIWLFMLVAAVTASCGEKNPGPGPDPEPEPGVGEITITESSTPNVYTLSANLPAGVSPKWKTGRGDGAEITGNNITAKYPLKGTYTITMSYMSTETYEFIEKTKTLTVQADNLSLVSVPAADLDMLAGTDSKTWVLDSLTTGHIGTGQSAILYPGDWVASPNEKAGTGLYQQKMTFKRDLGFTLINNGIAFGAGLASEVEMKDRGAVLHAEIEDQWEDRVYDYTPETDWKWLFWNDGEKSYVYFAPKTGFLIYFRPSPQNYEITKLTENELHVRQVSSEYKTDNVALYMKFIKEGYTHPVIPENIYAEDDFEGTMTFVNNFTKEGLGDLSEYGGANPVKGGINESDKVGVYDRGTGWYGRMVWYNDAKFDLATYNKVKMKVYIPSANDYDTISSDKEDWSDGKLKKRVVVRFLDGTAAEPWQPAHRIEVAKDGLETDKWIELTFDFSASADRTDMDTMVIQFGDEGHGSPGTFYFDDIKFYGGGQ